MDSDRSSKVRALALASRCMSREITRLMGRREDEDTGDESAYEVDRVVRLARHILDPGYTSGGAWTAEGVQGTDKKPSSNGRGSAEAEVALIDLLGDGPPSPRHTLALLGHGSRIPIPELVSFLGTLGVDGILKVSTEKELFMVEFDAGHIAHGEASRAPAGQRLGDLLVSQGAIDRLVLEGLCLEGATWKLGRRLLDENLITREQLVRALQAQIQLLFCRLFREDVKGFTFWKGPLLCAEEGMRLNSTSLLLEGARAHDEAADISRALDEAQLEEEP